MVLLEDDDRDDHDADGRKKRGQERNEKTELDMNLSCVCISLAFIRNVTCFILLLHFWLCCCSAVIYKDYLYRKK